MKARKRVIQGSTSAGKTYGIIPVIANDCILNKGLKATIVGETIPAVKDGPVDIFKKTMQDTGRWVEGYWIGNPMEYTFSNGSRIQFKAFDSVGKAKASGKRDILFLNECNHITYDIADALIIRSKVCYFDFNPDNEFWVHSEILPEPNSEFLKLTYLDNEALPSETLQDLLAKRAKAYFDPDGDLLDPNNIKSAYWANWWQVYGLGNIGKLTGTIFPNWKKYRELPQVDLFRLIVIDWGGNDPTTVTELHIDGDNKRLYIREIIYQPQILNSKLIEIVHANNPNNDIVICDNARKDKIFELNMASIPAIGYAKGLIMDGLDLMQDFDIFVHEDSLNAQSEFDKYCYATDALGKSLNVPIDNHNHVVDPTRYGIRFYTKNIRGY